MKIYHNEIDDRCCEVLERQFPDSVVDRRSIQDVQSQDLAPYRQCHFFAGIGGFSEAFRRAGLDADFNVWTGGFPCQDLSVAGKRAGLAGNRSGLYFDFQRLINQSRPEIVVAENVPGLLSSNEGLDFAIVVAGLTGIVPAVPADGWGSAGFFHGRVYSVAYRVFDAQYFGVAQRRRRVFIVASLGTGRCAEILFESESLPGDPAESRQTGQGTSASVAPSLEASGRGTSRAGESRGQDPVIAVAPFDPRNVTSKTNQTRVEYNTPANTLHEMGQAIVFDWQSGGDVRHHVGDKPNLQAHQTPAVLAATAFGGGNTSGPIDIATARNVKGDTRLDFDTETFVAYTSDLEVGEEAEVIAFIERTRAEGRNFESQKELSYALTNPGGGGRAHSRSIAGGFGVRRLTPTECARLQGFPDDWNDWLSDSVRYRQFGNAVAVPNVEWIARRIKSVCQ